MSFPVAVQSAVFWVLACTPCAAARARKRTKQKAKRDRAERAQLEADDPDAYRHPIPFHHNPYWEEEMTMGPSLPKKGNKGSKNNSQRHLTSAGQDSNPATRSSLAISGKSVPVGDKGLTLSTNVPGQRPPASPSIQADDASFHLMYSTTGSSMDGWNHKRYQREDEELWGSEFSRTGKKMMDAMVKAGQSAGRLLESTLAMNTGSSNANDNHPYNTKAEMEVTDEDRSRFYLPAKNPPINDYHPPIASSKPAHPEALSWMLQPPPSAKIMEGKIPVSRSHSIASSYSRRRTPGASDASLGRVMSASQRQLTKMTRSRSTSLGQGDGTTEMEKLAPSPVLLSRPTSRRTVTARSKSHKSARSARSRDVSTDEEGTEESSGSPKTESKKKRRKVPAPLDIGSPKEQAEDDKKRAVTESHAAQRPRLETILSSDASASVVSDGKTESLAAVASAGLPANSLAKTRATGGSLDSGLALSS